MNTTKVWAEYSEHGYNVFANNSLYYSAGNSPFDSQADAGSDVALPLKTLRKYAIQTARDIADEISGKYIGCDKV